ncbi:hypothetical protein LCGC14_2876000 [marine sediment metagenome]|uniref:Uncharacterized protein n=1 Tax=marine sediment metagenome TaxID=412755 RepID=A0A0F8XFS2_9ZZZZ
MSKPSQEPIKVKPVNEWDEKCKDCPVAGILINQLSDPKYSERERSIIFYFIQDVYEDLSGEKFPPPKLF